MEMKACIFDAYGTLFDVNAAARNAVAGFPVLEDRWEALAATWRGRQVMYSWLRAVMGDHCDFWQVTKEALDWTLADEGLEDAALREGLLALYWQLDAFAEVPAMLATVQATGRRAAILSNGAPEMLAGAVESAGIAEFLTAILSVEEVGVFKPDARVYGLVEARLGVAPGDALFVSSNGWDIAGAAAFGFRTLWVNRTGAPVERLPGRPDHVLPDLAALPGLLR